MANLFLWHLSSYDNKLISKIGNKRSFANTKQMETYRTFHRGFVVYSMWIDTCEEQYYAQKEK